MFLPCTLEEIRNQARREQDDVLVSIRDLENVTHQDKFADALDDVTVCVMNHADVDRLLLSDARIAARIAEILGRRLADLEQRLSDRVFKSVSQRVATTLLMLVTRSPAGQPLPSDASCPEVALTHGQLAALVGTARESVTKVLSRFAELGLVRLSRGHITVLDLDRLRDAAG
jgi:CRP-like cAMP-binding protein